METFCIALGIVGLMIFAYRGWSIILIAPLFACIAGIFSVYGILPTYTELYMTRFAEYTKTYYPVFLFGAVFARLMEKGGLASAIAEKIIDILGEKRAILSVILGCMALTYGGLSVFVVAFVMYPFGAELFRKADIPKKLLPATLCMGIFTGAMVALPGSPQIQNIIPTSYFGTTTWAAPIIGIFATLLFMGEALSYLIWRAVTLKNKGEGYGQEADSRQRRDRTLPSAGLAVLPLVLIIVINIVLSNPFGWSWGFHWDENSLELFKPFGLSLIATSVGKVSAIWSISVALIVASFVAAYIGRRKFKKGGERYIDNINYGAVTSCGAVLNVSSGFAFGSVLVSLPGFLPVTEVLASLGNSMGPLISATVTTNVMGAITGSASGGMTIALNLLGKEWLDMAIAQNIPPEVLHRIVSIASVGIDPVPHNGALVTLLSICALTHKIAYFDILVLMAMKFFIPYMCVAFYLLTGLC